MSLFIKSKKRTADGEPSVCIGYYEKILYPTWMSDITYKTVNRRGSACEVFRAFLLGYYTRKDQPRRRSSDPPYTIHTFHLCRVMDWENCVVVFWVQFTLRERTYRMIQMISILNTLPYHSPTIGLPLILCQWFLEMFYILNYSNRQAAAGQNANLHGAAYPRAKQLPFLQILRQVTQYSFSFFSPALTNVYPFSGFAAQSYTSFPSLYGKHKCNEHWKSQ